jgi:hypothetical protein
MLGFCIVRLASFGVFAAKVLGDPGAMVNGRYSAETKVAVAKKAKKMPGPTFWNLNIQSLILKSADCASSIPRLKRSHPNTRERPERPTIDKRSKARAQVKIVSEVKQHLQFERDFAVSL